MAKIEEQLQLNLKKLSIQGEILKGIFMSLQHTDIC